jgi:glycosyltransferase involved in cell wall biosynthesis
MQGDAGQDRVKDTRRAGPHGPVICMLVPGGLEHAGGMGRWAGYVLGAWSKAGDDRPQIVIVDTRGRGSRIFGVLAFPLALWRLAGFFFGGRLALIHANLASRGSTVRKCIVTYLASRLGVPVIVHLHGAFFDRFYLGLGPIARRLVQGMFARADRVLVLGEVWRRFLVDRVGVAEDKVEILFNGVPEPRVARHPAPPGTPCRIVMLGRLGARKGVPELLAAFGSAALRGRRWQATLAGDGEVEATRRQVAELGLADRVALPGWVDAAEAADLLAEADVLVLASHAENMPLSVLEALAHGVAVVATPVGTTPEILADGVSALLVPPGDAAALAQALARLIDDPDLRQRIAAAGHEVFRRQLDIARAADRLATLYRAHAPTLQKIGR